MKILDFTRKKVRLNGKVLDKFDVAYLIDDIKPHFHATIIMDVFSYKELADFLLEFLKARNCIDFYGKKYMIVENQ